MTPMVPSEPICPGWEALAHYFADELVDRWNETDFPFQPPPLAEWMGLTEREYAAWVECRFADLASSLAARSAA